MNLKCNCCDGVYNSFDVHYTSLCDNKCAHCIDNKFSGTGINIPDNNAIIETIISNSKGVDDVLFLGGEPCIFLNELVECVKELKKWTKLKLYVTTSVPAICYKERDKFVELISLLDGINLSVQHFKPSVADSIRQTISQYDREKFYSKLPMKEKIRININIVKPYLYTKKDIEECIYHYDKLGFGSIKISEIQHGEDVFVSFEKVFNRDYGSPYSNGCQTYLDNDDLFPGTKIPILLKRSCFVCEDTMKASLKDGYKVIRSLFNKQNNKYGVIYEDGSLQKGWI